MQTIKYFKEQRTLPNILGYMSWEDTTSWADLKGSPELSRYTP